MSTLQPFYKESLVADITWQALERLILRILTLKGFEHIWHVGQSKDGGADVIAIRPNIGGGEDIKWLVQAKKLNRPVDHSVIKETLSALVKYGAKIPVIVSAKGFSAPVFERKNELSRQDIHLQLWDPRNIEEIGRSLPADPIAYRGASPLELRKYQSLAIERILERYTDHTSRNALVVLATGLGKTITAAEAVRRIRACSTRELRVLVLAHTVDLVHQLERCFWPFMSTGDATCVLGGGERPKSFDDLSRYGFVFATRDSVHEAQNADLFPNDIFDIVIVDECHHLGAATYESVLDVLRAGQDNGPFMLGLTATPWRPSGESLSHRFDDPVVQIDLPTGLRDGYLANVDYRIFTDNVNWSALKQLKGDRFTPEKINRTLFITDWTDGVIERTQEAWLELKGKRRGIVFCGTIYHAETVAKRINAIGFTNAKVIASRDINGKTLTPIERSRILFDFSSGKIGILCAVDVLNEGIDVPDVNLVVFQRVTHSRRIFIQQLGRGLRLKKGKDKVIVLDFVTDIRRFAEAISLGKALDGHGPRPGSPVTVKLPSRVSFRRATGLDFDSKEFLTQWLQDIDAIADSGEDASVLAFPDFHLLPNEPNVI